MKRYFYWFVFFWLGIVNLYAQEELGYYHKAQTSFKAGRYDQAISIYRRAIQVAAENSTNLHDYHYQIARCYYQTRQADNAIQALKQSIEIKNTYVPAHVLLARVYAKTKQPELANQALEAAFKHEKDPTKRASYMLQIVKGYMKQNKLPLALTKITEARAIAPKNVMINYFFAKISNELGNYADAKNAILSIEDTLKTMDQKDNARYYYELGRSYYFLKDAKNANKTFEKAKYGSFAKKIPKPVTPKYLLSIANSYMKIHENEITKIFIDSALKMDEALPGAYVMSAQLSKREMSSSEMLESLKTAVTNEVNIKRKVQYYDKIAGIQIDEKKYAACLQTLDQVMKLREDDPMAWFQKGIALYKMQRYEESIEALLTILKVADNQRIKANIQFLLGKVYAKNGQLDLSKKAFQTALRSASRDAAALELRQVEIALKRKE